MRSSFQDQPALIYIYCLFGWLLTSRGLYATTMVSSFLPPARAAKTCHPPPVQLPQRFCHNLSHSKLPSHLNHSCSPTLLTLLCLFFPQPWLQQAAQAGHPPESLLLNPDGSWVEAVGSPPPGGATSSHPSSGYRTNTGSLKTEKQWEQDVISK